MQKAMEWALKTMKQGKSNSPPTKHPTIYADGSVLTYGIRDLDPNKTSALQPRVSTLERHTSRAPWRQNSTCQIINIEIKKIT